MNKKSKKLDLNQLAKRIVDKATDETAQEEIDEKKKPLWIKSGMMTKKKNQKNRFLFFEI